MSARFVAALDQGTTSSRCLLFDRSGRIVSGAQQEHRQITPRPGWVEHDPDEIVERSRACIDEALAGAGARPPDVAAIGIANQRETVVLWERESGRPLANAIVWQDVRSADRVAALGHVDRFRAQTGLPLATYFSGPKLSWLLDSLPGARARAEAGELAAGTIDSWLAWQLAGAHVTDPTNASRTLLMDLATLEWDAGLLDAIGVPRALLAEIGPSSRIVGEIGGVPLAALLGDQHAALFGQCCFAPGEAKCTYGTGNFLVLNTGARAVPSSHGLITGVAYQLGDQPPAYMLEGSIAVTGALVQWLRDNLGLIEAAS
ncbi:MAG: glycerol kinase, partial [Gaiellales bacterium]|nr:glycerol kinase [Gaiellales bacterium]